MKLLIVVIQAEDTPHVIEALTHSGYRVTKIATVGGWLRKANTTLLIGLNDNQVWHATKLLRRLAGQRTELRLSHGDPAVGLAPDEVLVEVGGLTLFVLDVERSEHL